MAVRTGTGIRDSEMEKSRVAGRHSSGVCRPPQPPTSTPVRSLAGQCALDQPMPPAEFRLCGHAGRYPGGSYPATLPP